MTCPVGLPVGGGGGGSRWGLRMGYRPGRVQDLFLRARPLGATYHRHEGAVQAGPDANHDTWRGGRVLLKGGGVQGGWVGGWVGLWGGTPPPPGDPELLEAPKAPKKFFGPN